MRKIFIMLACAVMLLSCGGNKDNTTIVKEGDAVPQFSVQRIDGTQFNIADYKGDVVWINFWATWCPPCQQELKRVQSDIIDRFEGKSFEFIPISRGEDEATVKAFLAENNYEFVPGLDPDSSVYNLFAKQYIPRNFIVDQTGKIVALGVGYTPEEFDEMVNTVELLLNK